MEVRYCMDGTVRRFPAGVQSFSVIREGNYAYVDKTALMYRLIDQGVPVFLSRPRRFGKSLLISTLEAYFLGHRELFKGLAIDSLTEEWEPRPVFHIDLSGRNYNAKERITQVLSIFLTEWEKKYGKDDAEIAVEDRFQGLIRRAYEFTGKKAVILIDEYDKPLLDTLDDEKKDLHDYFREVLRGFYGCLKSCDKYLRFVMLTGVTKFSQVNIFSGLNNIQDISLEPRYSTICGITPEEIRECLKDGVEALAEGNGKTYEAMLDTLRDWYDGYHFASDMRDVYNPFSLMSVLRSGEIKNYWYASGNPEYLIRKIRNEELNLYDLQRRVETGARLQAIDLATSDPIPLMYQSGYLTIKGYDAEFGDYMLDYPNREIKESFISSLVPLYVGGEKDGTPFSVRNFIRDVRGGDIEGFMRRFQSLFAGFPYDQISDCERHYHNVVYLTFTLMGFYAHTEYRTSDGRCDAVVVTDRYIYIFEFKYDRTAEEALRQIEEKGYALPFSAEGKEIIEIGVNFSSSTRRIEGYLIKRTEQ